MMKLALLTLRSPEERKGEWIELYTSYECAVCHAEFEIGASVEGRDPIEDFDLRYCPHCGDFKDTEGK